jgi:uncharacterized protein
MATAGLASGIDPNATGQRPRPINPSERIDAIDALRGIALLGVLAINVVTEFRISIFEQFLSQPPAASPVDRAVETILTLAVEMKAFALFSLLFGLGLAIQAERLAGSAHRTQLLVRRLMVLLAIGLVHLCLIWNGDILTEYALAGLVVLPFLFGPRWLLALGALAFLALNLIIPEQMPAGTFPSITAMMQDIAEANRIYATGGFLEVLAFRIRELPLIFLLHVYVFPRTIGLFLLGAFVWRAGILRRQSINYRLLFSVAAGGICVGLALTIVKANGLIAVGGVSFFAGSLGTIFLALGYGAAVIGVANLETGKALLGWAAPLGRMAFTNYLVQSLIFGWIFYGYGLGLFARLGAATALAIGIAVYAGQVVLSRWWLNRYRYGPVEWLWRTLMYGTAQPMSLLPRVRVA